MTNADPSPEETRAALARFLELYEQAEQEGQALRDGYRQRGEKFWEDAAEIQLAWLRERRDLVLEGLLLPDGKSAFGMSRVLSEFEHGPEGEAFDRTSRAFEQYWYDGLGLPGWQWQEATPPGWDEAAAAVPRVFAQKLGS